jgi:hypothetical protein
VLVIVAAVVIVVLLVGGGLVAWLLTHRNDPKSVALPPPSKTSATTAYLQGDGSALVDFWRQTRTVDGGASAAECRLLATRLAKDSNPAELVSRAEGVPEPATRDALLGHVGAVATYLSACVKGDGAGSAADDVRYSGVVVGRLLARAGVR